MSPIVETSQTTKIVTFSFPNDEFRAKDIQEIGSLVRVALIARKSRMSAEEAEAIAEDIKASWWGENRDRILKMIDKNG